MIRTKQKKLPPTHPGELLRDEIMPAAKLTQDRLAGLFGVSRRTINEIVTGEAEPVRGYGPPIGTVV